MYPAIIVFPSYIVTRFNFCFFSKLWYFHKRNLSIGDKKLFYAKMKYNNGFADGIMETFDITTEELMDYTVSEDTMQVGE